MTKEERREKAKEWKRLYRLRNAEKCKAYAAAYRLAHKPPLRPIPTEKTCQHCHASKPLDAFTKQGKFTAVRSHRGGLGRDHICRACRSAIRTPHLADVRRAMKDLHDRRLKQCNVCRLVLSFDLYCARRKSPDGLCSTCRECSRLRNAAWKQANPDAFKAWYQDHQEERRRAYREWASSRRDERRAAYKAWAKANPGLVNANVVRRQLSKRRATPAWVDPTDLKPFYIEAARLTRATGVKHDVDHIVPIRSRIVCGLHVPANLQILTRAQNLAKSNTHVPTAASSFSPYSVAVR